MKIETFLRKRFYILLGMLLSLGVSYLTTQYPEILSIATVPTPKPTSSQLQNASPSATPQASHGGVFATVVSVVDGDTIKIEGGEVVRYIGMDTPETVAPNRPIGCFGKEASDKNKALVQGKVVELVKDVSNRDRYGRLLRYIWIGDEMINETLVREGYAQVSTYPPDVAYVDRFVAAQRKAESDKAGMWSGACPIVSPTSVPTASPSALPSGV